MQVQGSDPARAVSLRFNEENALRPGTARVLSLSNSVLANNNALEVPRRLQCALVLTLLKTAMAGSTSKASECTSSRTYRFGIAARSSSSIVHMLSSNSLAER